MRCCENSMGLHLQMVMFLSRWLEAWWRNVSEWIRSSRFKKEMYRMIQIASNFYWEWNELKRFFCFPPHFHTLKLAISICADATNLFINCSLLETIKLLLSLLINVVMSRAFKWQIFTLILSISKQIFNRIFYDEML